MPAKFEPGASGEIVPRAEPDDPPLRSPDRTTAAAVRRRIGAALLIVLAGGLAGGQESDREAELERIRADIARLQARLERLRSERSGVAGALAGTELELELQGRRVQEVRTERALAAERLARTAIRISDLETEMDRSRAALRERLVDLYRLGRAGPLRLLLSIRSERHLLPGIRLLRYLARREASAIDAFIESRARLAVEGEELAALRREIEGLLAREASRLESLGRLRGRQRDLLAALEKEQQTVAARTERLIDKERKLANFLDFLYGRNPSPLAGTPMQNFRGVLDWPCAGKVVGHFGPRLDPRYQTRVPHNGIEIDTRPGSEVKAVFPGKVLFAAPFQGYGLTAVVHHPRRVFSLYAGLEELKVGSDDMLSLGQAVGLAGERLYFEIRVENRPEDPLTWLR